MRVNMCFVFKYENRRMKHVEIVLRSRERGWWSNSSSRVPA
jgi:hypothetical protein